MKTSEINKVLNKAKRTKESTTEVEEKETLEEEKEPVVEEEETLKEDKTLEEVEEPALEVSLEEVKEPLVENNNELVEKGSDNNAKKTKTTKTTKTAKRSTSSVKLIRETRVIPDVEYAKILENGEVETQTKDDVEELIEKVEDFYKAPELEDVEKTSSEEDKSLEESAEVLLKESSTSGIKEKFKRFKKKISDNLSEPKFIPISEDEVRSILSGEKKLDFKLERPQDLTYIYIYSGLRPVATVTVEKCMSGLKEELWEDILNISPISKDDFDKLYANQNRANAIIYGKVKKHRLGKLIFDKGKKKKYKPFYLFEI